MLCGNLGCWLGNRLERGRNGGRVWNDVSLHSLSFLAQQNLGRVAQLALPSLNISFFYLSLSLFLHFDYK